MIVFERSHREPTPFWDPVACNFDGTQHKAWLARVWRDSHTRCVHTDLAPATAGFWRIAPCQMSPATCAAVLIADVHRPSLTLRPPPTAPYAPMAEMPGSPLYRGTRQPRRDAKPVAVDQRIRSAPTPSKKRLCLRHRLHRHRHTRTARVARHTH